jgi:hypothetical protein
MTVTSEQWVGAQVSRPIPATFPSLLLLVSRSDARFYFPTAANMALERESRSLVLIHSDFSRAYSG